MGHGTSKEQREAYILDFKRLIERYREIASKAYVGVKERSFKELYDECKVSRMWAHFIQEYLVKNELLSIKGETRAMTYKWVEQTTKQHLQDSHALARDMYEQCSLALAESRNNKKKPVRKVSIKDADKHDVQSYSSKPEVLPKPKEYELHAVTYFMEDNAIKEAVIVGKSFVPKMKEGEPYVKDLAIAYDFNRIQYTIFVSSTKTTLTKTSGEIFPSVDLLLESLKIRFDRKK